MIKPRYFAVAFYFGRIFVKSFFTRYTQFLFFWHGTLTYNVPRKGLVILDEAQKRIMSGRKTNLFSFADNCGKCCYVSDHDRKYASYILAV